MDHSQPPRNRHISWTDPAITAKAVPGMSGLAFLEAIRDGRLPEAPISHLLNFHLTEVTNGRVVFTHQPDESQYNPIGSIHGGIIATLLDSAMSCAVQSSLPHGQGYTTLEMKVNFIRPITIQTGPLQAIGQTIHQGRRSATAEGQLVDHTGKLYAHATTTCFIFDLSVR